MQMVGCLCWAVCMSKVQGVVCMLAWMAQLRWASAVLCVSFKHSNKVQRLVVQ